MERICVQCRHRFVMRSFWLPRRNCPKCGSSELQDEQSESSVLIDVVLFIALLALSFVVGLRVARATDWLVLKLTRDAGFATNMAGLVFLLSVPLFVSYGAFLLPKFSGQMVPTKKSSAEKRKWLFNACLRVTLAAIMICGSYLSTAQPILRDRVAGIAVCLVWAILMWNLANRAVAKDWQPKRKTDLFA